MYGVCVSKDSQKIITCSHDETIRVWEIMKGNLQKTVKAHTSTVYSVVLSPDGKLLATASADKTVKVSPAGQGAAWRSWGNGRRLHIRSRECCRSSSQLSLYQASASHVCRNRCGSWGQAS